MNKIESKVQEEIISYLKKNRVCHFRFQAQSNLNGLPDIFCLYKGLFIGLELKREKGGKPTGLQLRKIKSINDNGGIGLVVRSVEEVDTLFSVIDDNVYVYNALLENVRSSYMRMVNDILAKYTMRIK